MKKPEEKWRILAISSLVVCSSVGLSNARGVFLTPICDGLEITHTQYGFALTICSITTCLITFFISSIIRKFGIRITVLLGVAFQALSCVLCSVSRGCFLLYIAYSILGIGYSLFSQAIMLLIINRWFISNNGKAASILTSFGGISGALLSPILASVISELGWRIGELAAAIITVLLCMPFLLYRRSLFPCTDYNENVNDNEMIGDGNTITYATLIVCAVYGLSGFGYSVASALSSIGISIGLTSADSATMVSVLMIGSVVFKLIFGILADRLGAAIVTTAMLIITAASGVMMLCFNSRTMVFISSFLLGTLYAVLGLGLSLLAKELFGNDNYISCYSKMTLTYTVLYSLSNPIVGNLYDSYKTYDYSILLMIIISLICVFMLAFLIIRRKDTTK